VISLIVKLIAPIAKNRPISDITNYIGEIKKNR